MPKCVVWILVLTFLQFIITPSPVLGQIIPPIPQPFPPLPIPSPQPIPLPLPVPGPIIPPPVIPPPLTTSTSNGKSNGSSDAAWIAPLAIAGGGLLIALITGASRSSRRSQQSEGSQYDFLNFLPGFLPKAHNDPLTISGEFVILRW